MKLVWAAAVLMIVLVVTGILLEQAMMSGSDHVLQLLHRVEAAVLAGRFDEAEALLSEVEQEWARAGRFWCMFVYHHDMDRVGDSLIRLRQHIRFHDSQLSLVEISTSMQLIDHIPKKESFSLESVL
jgi:hypothetical protein